MVFEFLPRGVYFQANLFPLEFQFATLGYLSFLFVRIHNSVNLAVNNMTKIDKFFKIYWQLLYVFSNI